MAYYRTPWNRSHGYNKWVLLIGGLFIAGLLMLPLYGQGQITISKMKVQQKVEELEAKGYQVEVK